MTTSKITCKIEELIPQRSPIIMVDELLSVKDEECTCALTIRADNYFIEEDEHMAEVGIIEHMAQSASAFAGYRVLLKGAITPPVGYIGEVKNFHLYRRPRIGETLHTVISFGTTVGGVSAISACTYCENECIADTLMKIFIK